MTDGGDVEFWNMLSSHVPDRQEGGPEEAPAANTNNGYVTKDSGQRESFASGSVRDTHEGKGRFDLISPYALARLAGVYERGAQKYTDRNWEKGQPISRCLDSALRHLNRYAMGWRDEDHAAQALWNVAAVLHFEEMMKRGLLPPDLDDMPKYEKGPPAC